MRFYRETLFPAICDRAMRAPEIQDRRRRLVENVSGRVLEIGFGTGLSARFYGNAVTELVAVEPSEGMNDSAKSRIAAAAVPIRLMALAGENLPVDDGSMDHVVCSLTLCSVSDPAKVLSEVRRVLKPNGAFHFMEHVLSDHARVARWQRRLNPVQKVIGVGCNLDRDTPALIRAAGLELGEVPLERERAFPFSALFPIAQAVAVKPL